jgi:hypothetical protein
MTVTQELVNPIETIPPELVLVAGIILTGIVVIIGLYLGYKNNAHLPLKSNRVITQIAVFSALGFVISFIDIPFLLDTHIAFHHITDWPLAMAYGPFVGMISGAIVGAKGLLTGNWTGSVSNAFFGIVIGTFSMYINPEKRGRPFYMIVMNILIGTWTFGLIHMWYAYSGLVAPVLVILNLILSFLNNIIYAILIEIIINVEQIWDPLTEESNLKWYQDDYQEPSLEIQQRSTTLQILVLTALIYGWFSILWLSPPFVVFEDTIDFLFQPILFGIMITFAFILVVSSYLIYRFERMNLASPLALIGSILTLPVGLLSLYIWFKYLRYFPAQAT